MTEVEFYQYWKQYLMIEKEFKGTEKFLAVDEINASAYSDEYVRLLLQIGSEIDIVAKLLCSAINVSSSAWKIDEYKTEIISRYSEFADVTVHCKVINSESLTIKPWNGWRVDSPDWWKIYNGVKHNRNKEKTFDSVTKAYYKHACQKTILNALAALYQMELYLYCNSEHHDLKDTPMPGSRMFTLVDHGWEN